jgi:hypothetical protein
VRLAHGWLLENRAGLPRSIVREFIRPAVRAVPGALAARLGICHLILFPRLQATKLTSQWTQMGDGIEIALATEETEPHDLAMELLLCLGQAVWEAAEPGERRAYLKLLAEEMDAAVSGEIDEDALREKRLLLSSRGLARSPRRLLRYAAVSFAATAAEYVHCLWHDVTMRAGPDHLPPLPLRRRLETFHRWFPPDRGHRLFAR